MWNAHFSVFKVLLEYSHTHHLHIVYSCLLAMVGRVELLGQRQSGPQSQDYLLYVR